MERETKILLGVVGVVVVALVGVFVLFNKSGTTATSDASRIVRSDSQKQGSGKVNLVEFGDYQCPSCGQAYPIVKQIQADYTGKITLVFRNFPLETIHKNAKAAATYAEAAAKQGKFWEMHDMLYVKQTEWADQTDPTSKFADYARSLGMDSAKLKSDAASSQISQLISRDEDDGNALSVSGTPTFYVGTKQLASFDYNSIKTALDAALK